VRGEEKRREERERKKGKKEGGEFLRLRSLSFGD
jgi:hypothetical protein